MWIVKAWRWICKWAWLLLAIVAFVTGVIIAVAIASGRRKPGEIEPVKKFVEAAINRVDEIEKEAEVKKDEVVAVADENRAVVEEIKKDPEPVRRRNRVAGWIADNL
jgi:predicted transcriptional regulator